MNGPGEDSEGGAVSSPAAETLRSVFRVGCRTCDGGGFSGGFSRKGGELTNVWWGEWSLDPSGRQRWG